MVDIDQKLFVFFLHDDSIYYWKNINRVQNILNDEANEDS